MKKIFVFFLILLFIIPAAVFSAPSSTVVFYEKDFPAVENGPISRTSLERALAPLTPRFVGLDELMKDSTLKNAGLFILPYGSAFPKEAWDKIQPFLTKGNLLVIGGRPFAVPVSRDGKKWRIEEPQNTFSRQLGLQYSYTVPQKGAWTLQWDDDSPWFHVAEIDAQRVFVNAGYGGRYRGVGFFVNTAGDRVAAPVVAEDIIGFGSIPRRHVYLQFEAGSSYWPSQNGIELIRKAAIYASRGGLRLWLDIQHLTLDPGDHVTGAVDVVRTGEPVQLTLTLLSGTKVLGTRSVPCGSALHEEIGLRTPLQEPGIYTLRAALSVGDTVIEQYTSGVEVRDSLLLRSGSRLSSGRDYFRLDGKPYLMVGANYFSTDQYTSDFFVGSSLGGNPWIWEKDFAEMERLGLTAVRTGIWLNRARYLDLVSGAAGERLLRAIEAFLNAAARHHFQVIFTFFAFEPQSEMEAGPGQESNRLGPGSNPYLDPVSVSAQKAYVTAIASRFKDVPFLSFDLINEPSFDNPARVWQGNSPNGDPAERTAWHMWLEREYTTIDRLAGAWRVPVSELGSFSSVPLPSFADLQLARSGNQRTMRAVDYNRFAQDAFGSWIDTIITAIRNSGAIQAITVGQDEGGVADRVLNQFWAGTQVNYTVNHTWWRDDALLWSSVAAKNPAKPNLIGETGPQPAWAMDGAWRWDDIQGMPLLERKLTLGFANANTGVLHWDWTHSDTYGLFRRDGSQKQWMDVLKGIAHFAHDAQAYADETILPEIAIVLPQSLQFSTFGNWGLEVQQKCVRALYQFARADAFAVGEYQLASMPDAKLIIVPAPWILNQKAWEQLMDRVRSGATLLISGRIDADEHWRNIPERIRGLKLGYASEDLVTREAAVAWPGDSARLTFSEEKTTYAQRGVLDGNATFAELPLGKGTILYYAFPLEIADQLEAIGRVYRFAIRKSGVLPPYETSCDDPGILIAPTQLSRGTLYVLTSESASSTPFSFRDSRSGKLYTTSLTPGRAALLLIDANGKIVASYNTAKE